jgi:hypothetical protein
MTPPSDRTLLLGMKQATGIFQEVSSAGRLWLIRMQLGPFPPKATLVCGAALLTLTLACKSGGGMEQKQQQPPPPPTPIASATCSDPTASVVITDPTNYTLSDSFSLQHVVLKDNTDLVFDWSQLTVDFFGKPVTPTTDINTVSISLWNLKPADIEQALKVDNLPLGSNSGVITTFPDGTYTKMDLLGFNELGNPLPTDELWSRFDTATPNYQYPQDQYTFLVMAQSGTDVGRQPHSIALFNIDPGATATELDLTNDSTTLTYSVDLSMAQPMLVPAGAPFTIDWSQMTENCLGNTYDYSQITEVSVAHFETETLSQLQTDFLNLEDIADGWWSGPVIAGASLDLSTLVDQNGVAFTGIDSTGIWMAALFCTNCNNPAPWSITILQPCQ